MSSLDEQHKAPLWLLLLVVALLFQELMASEFTRHYDEIKHFSAVEFRQERHIEALSRTLISTGTIELSDDGFVWKQHSPYQVSLIYDGKSIVEKTIVGGLETTKQILDPVINNLTRTLFHLIAGSSSNLESVFTITITQNGASPRWCYGLEPKESAVQSSISRVVLCGNIYLDRIRIEESQNNYTLIELTNPRPSA